MRRGQLFLRTRSCHSIWWWWFEYSRYVTWPPRWCYHCVSWPARYRRLSWGFWRNSALFCRRKRQQKSSPHSEAVVGAWKQWRVRAEHRGYATTSLWRFRPYSLELSRFSVGSLGRLAVQVNQDTLHAFFCGAKTLLAKHGEVHVSMLGDEARTAWNVAGIAAQAGLLFERSWIFSQRFSRIFTLSDVTACFVARARQHVSWREERCNNSMNITTVGCVDAADEDVQSGGADTDFPAT